MFTLDALEYGKFKTGIDATGINFAVQTFSAKIPGAFSTALGTFLLSLTSFVLVEADSIADLAASGFVQTKEAIDQMWIVTGLPGIISSLISNILLLCFYKLYDAFSGFCFKLLSLYVRVKHQHKTGKE